MIQDWGGYYRTKMTVQPYSGGPTIEQGLYDFINREFYYQTDAPITMRLGFSEQLHIRPSSEAAMPTDVLALPEKMFDKMDVHPSAEDVTVLVLKPAHAYLFNKAENIGQGWGDSSNISDTTLDEADEEFFDIENYSAEE